MFHVAFAYELLNLYITVHHLQVSMYRYEDVKWPAELEVLYQQASSALISGVVF